MKHFTKKVCAVLTVGTLMACFTGCKEEKSKYSDPADDISYLAQEDMAYGATITQLKPEIDENISIAIEYDNRYLNEDEARKLSNYVAALNNCDSELMSQTFYKPFLDNICEQSGAADLDEYLKNMHDNLVNNYIGYDFDFDYVLTVDCLTEEDDDSETNFSAVDASLDNTGDSDKITSRKLVTFDLEYSIDGSEDSYMLSTSTGTNSSLYIYTIDGEVYIL